MVADSAEDLDIVGSEVLHLLLVGYFQAADGIIAQFDWCHQDIPGNRVQLLVELQVLSTLLLALGIGAVLDVDGLSGVENC